MRCHHTLTFLHQNTLSPYRLKTERKQSRSCTIPQLPLQGLKCFGHLRVNKRAVFPGFLSQPHKSMFSLESWPLPQPPHEVSIQKAKGKGQKNQNGLEPSGPPQPHYKLLQVVYWGSEEGARPRAQPHLWQCPEAPVFSITAKAFLPSLPGPGKKLHVQYLLIPKIRTP
jgi:hypothetical protein